MELAKRFQWASSKLMFNASSQLLEVGCGTGALAGALSQRLKSGSILGIDRSASSLSKARVLHKETILNGQLAFERSDFKDFEVEIRFDIIFAFNVRAFWSQTWALEQAERFIKPKGKLVLFHQAPTPLQFAKINRLLTEFIESQGWVQTETEVARMDSKPCAYFCFQKNG